MPDTFATEASVADLNRRLATMETLVYGFQQGVPQPSMLVSLYWAACREERFDEALARHWERQVFLLDARALLAMARRVRDPVPWHPILVVLDRISMNDIDVEACRQHLLSVAQDLLNLQGFRKITPRDVMGNQLRVKTVLAAISRRGDLTNGKTTAQDD